MGFKGETVGREYVDQQRLGVAPSFGIRPRRADPPHRELLLPRRRQHPRLRLPVPARQAGSGGSAGQLATSSTASRTGTTSTTTSTSAPLRFEHDFNENVRLRNTLRLAMMDRGSLVSIPAIVGTPTAATPLSRSWSRAAARSGASRRASSTPPTWWSSSTRGSLKHTLVAGVEASQETSDVQRYTFGGVPNAELLNPTTFPNLGGHDAKENFNGSSSATAVGVFAVDEMAITDWWKIIGGLRYDLLRRHFRNRFAAQKLPDRRGAEPARRAVVFAHQGADLLLLLRHLVQPLGGGPRARRSTTRAPSPRRTRPSSSARSSTSSTARSACAARCSRSTRPTPAPPTRSCGVQVT